MDLALTEEQAMIQDMARKFAEGEVVPVAEKLDQEGDRETLLRNLAQLAELGFMGLNIKAEHGGTEAGGGAFLLGIITSFMIGVFYLVITIWIFGYLVMAAAGQLDYLARPVSFGEYIGSPTIFGVLLLVAAIVGGAFTVMSALSFGMLDFFTEFISYAGQSKSFFDLIVDVFYDTILPLNGLLVCLIVSFRWKKQRLNAELETGNVCIHQKLARFSLVLSAWKNQVFLKY